MDLGIGYEMMAVPRKLENGKESSLELAFAKQRALDHTHPPSMFLAI